MKVILYVLLLLVCYGCSEGSLQSAKHVENFKGTPVYELAAAVSKEDTLLISEILKEQNIDIDFENKIWDMSVLEMAVLLKKNISVDFLLKNGANPFLKTKRATAFSLAAQTDNLESISLISEHCNIDSIPIKIIRYSLHDAYFDGNKSFDYLTKIGIQYKDTLGTSLYNSVYFMNYEYTLELLKKGVIFNDSVAYICPDLLNGETPQTISYLLLNKKGYNFNSTPEFIVDRQRDKLIEYLYKEKLLRK